MVHLADDRAVRRDTAAELRGRALLRTSQGDAALATIDKHPPAWAGLPADLPLAAPPPVHGVDDQPRPNATKGRVCKRTPVGRSAVPHRQPATALVRHRLKAR